MTTPTGAREARARRGATSLRSLRIAALVVAATSIAWLDPHRPIRDANELYAEGKYEDAAAGYNAALVDHPDSADLHFNLGDATYKQGKYDEAIAAFQKVETATDPRRASRVAYNVGNASFRKGQGLEQTEPQKALQLYAEALASYRRALGITPDDEDAKFNYELVTQKIDELKKRLEEQKKNQDQQQDQQKDQQQDQQQQNQDQKNQDQQQPDQQQQQGDQQQNQPDQAKDEQEKQDQQQQDQQQQGEQKQDQQEQAGGEQQEQQKPEDQQQKDGGAPGNTEQQSADQKPGDQQQQPPEGDVYADEKKNGELSKGEAAAILDSQRGEEVAPEDVIRKLQGARVAEPSQDW